MRFCTPILSFSEYMVSNNGWKDQKEGQIEDVWGTLKRDWKEEGRSHWKRLMT